MAQNISALHRFFPKKKDKTNQKASEERKIQLLYFCVNGGRY